MKPRIQCVQVFCGFGVCGAGASWRAPVTPVPRGRGPGPPVHTAWLPRSCSSSDMAGTFMLYPPGTDGAAVTDVRLHGSRPSQHPESRKHQNALEPGFHGVPSACRLVFLVLQTLWLGC